jgi:hypothetical protein
MIDESGPTPAPDRRARLRLVTDTDAAEATSPAAGDGPPDPVQDPDEVNAAPPAVEPTVLPAPPVAEAEPADREWGWVTRWRGSGEPIPWATGLPLTAFAALLTAVAVWVLSAGLAGRPVLAVALNLLVAGGLAPAMWLSRRLPVLRWFAYGAAVGVVGGWIAALTMLAAG